MVFSSQSTNFVDGDANSWDIFVRDRSAGTIELVDVSTSGVQANGTAGIWGFMISRDGRYVVFESRANNLVLGDSNGCGDIFLRDRANGTTELVSLSAAGVQANGDSSYPTVSGDGRFVAFSSRATNLVPGDANGVDDVFVRDRRTGTTERVSVSSQETEGNSDSFLPVISADGRFVAFVSIASNLVAGDSNGTNDIFVRDRRLGTTQRVSITSDGREANSGSGYPAISGNGRYVAFASMASNLVPGDSNHSPDVFLHDLRTGTTEIVSVATGGEHGNSGSSFPSVSADGRFVAFESFSTNLPDGGNGVNVYVRDRTAETTEIVSIKTNGERVQGGAFNELASISDDGRYVVFRSANRDLVPGDSNGSADVFLHDRWAAGFTSVCSPGIDGVAGCPCGNPPTEPGRGCANSASRQGASLSAQGIAYLSIDSLVLVTTDESPSSPSVVFESAESSSAGTAYGQGVRCLTGPLVRLYTKTSVGGGIRAPDFGAGDAAISATSASKGLRIRPGQPTFFFVAYRDRVVGTGCPASATFNATQTAEIVWWP